MLSSYLNKAFFGEDENVIIREDPVWGFSEFPHPGDAKKHLLSVLIDPDAPIVIANGKQDADNDVAPIAPQAKEFWMPDRFCKVCYGCEEAFTMYRRRHHCRMCGQIFCNTCSSFYIDGALFDTQGLVRACRLCYDQLFERTERETRLARRKLNEKTAAALAAAANKDIAAAEKTRQESAVIPFGGSIGGGDSAAAQRTAHLRADAAASAAHKVLMTYSLRLQKRAEAHVYSIVDQLVSTTPLLNDDSSKSVEWKNIIVNLVREVVASVDPDVRGGDSMDIRPYVKIKIIPGGSLSENAYIDGVVFRKNVSHKKMAFQGTKRVPRIMLLAGGIEFQRTDTKLSSMDTLIEQEDKYMEILVDKIMSLKPDIILVGKSVARKAQELLCSHQVVVMQNVKPQLLERIARMTSAMLLPSTDHMIKQFGEECLGTCNEFRLHTVQDDPDRLTADKSSRHRVLRTRILRGSTYAYVQGCPSERGCTLVIRGESRAKLAEVKRIIRFSLVVAYHLRLEVAYYCDRRAELVPLVPLLPPSRSSSSGASDSSAAATTTADNGAAASAPAAAVIAEEDEDRDYWTSTHRENDDVLFDPSSDCEVDSDDESESESDYDSDTTADSAATTTAGTDDELPSGHAKNKTSTAASSSILSGSVISRPPQRKRKNNNKIGLVERIKLSTSLDIDIGLPYSHELTGLDSKKNSKLVNSRSGIDVAATSAQDHQTLIITSLLIGDTGDVHYQKSSAEVKGIRFYTRQDIALGQFIIENCFQLNRGGSSASKLLDHTLSFVHRPGRIDINVSKLDTGFTSPVPGAPAGGVGPDGEQAPVIAASAASAAAAAAVTGGANGHGGNASSGPGGGGSGVAGGGTSGGGGATSYHAAKDPMRLPIVMYSFCKECRRIVTPKVVISDETWKMSFGKFLEMFFYNRTARCHTGDLAGGSGGGTCRHAIRDNHSLSFQCENYVAVFNFVPVHPQSLHVREGLTFPESFYISQTLKILHRLPEKHNTLIDDFKLALTVLGREVQEVLWGRIDDLALAEAEVAAIEIEMQTAAVVFYEDLIRTYTLLPQNYMTPEVSDHIQYLVHAKNMLLKATKSVHAATAQKLQSLQGPTAMQQYPKNRHKPRRDASMVLSQKLPPLVPCTAANNNNNNNSNASSAATVGKIDDLSSSTHGSTASDNSSGNGTPKGSHTPVGSHTRQHSTTEGVAALDELQSPVASTVSSIPPPPAAAAAASLASTSSHDLVSDDGAAAAESLSRGGALLDTTGVDVPPSAHMSRNSSAGATAAVGGVLIGQQQGQGQRVGEELQPLGDETFGENGEVFFAEAGQDEEEEEEEEENGIEILIKELSNATNSGEGSGEEETLLRYPMYHMRETYLRAVKWNARIDIVYKFLESVRAMLLQKQQAQQLALQQAATGVAHEHRNLNNTAGEEELNVYNYHFALLQQQHLLNMQMGVLPKVRGTPYPLSQAAVTSTSGGSSSSTKSTGVVMASVASGLRVDTAGTITTGAGARSPKSNSESDSPRLVMPTAVGAPSSGSIASSPNAAASTSAGAPVAVTGTDAPTAATGEAIGAMSNVDLPTEGSSIAGKAAQATNTSDGAADAAACGSLGVASVSASSSAGQDAVVALAAATSAAGGDTPTNAAVTATPVVSLLTVDSSPVFSSSSPPTSSSISTSLPSSPAKLATYKEKELSTLPTTNNNDTLSKVLVDPSLHDTKSSLPPQQQQQPIPNSSSKKQAPVVAGGMGRITKAITRFLVSGGKETVADTNKKFFVPLSEFGEGRYGMPAGRRGEVVPVHEEEFASIIAYALSSDEYFEGLQASLREDNLVGPTTSSSSAYGGGSVATSTGTGTAGASAGATTNVGKVAGVSGKYPGGAGSGGSESLAYASTAKNIGGAASGNSADIPADLSLSGGNDAHVGGNSSSSVGGASSSSSMARSYAADDDNHFDTEPVVDVNHRVGKSELDQAFARESEFLGEGGGGVVTSTAFGGFSGADSSRGAFHGVVGPGAAAAAIDGDAESVCPAADAAAMGSEKGGASDAGTSTTNSSNPPRDRTGSGNLRRNSVSGGSAAGATTGVAAAISAVEALPPRSVSLASSASSFHQSMTGSAHSMMGSQAMAPVATQQQTSQQQQQQQQQQPPQQQQQQPQSHHHHGKSLREKQMISQNKSYIRIRFDDMDDKGNSLCKFQCQVYWATQFEAVRACYLKEEDGNDNFVRSLSMSERWSASGGKSGASFSKSLDERFILKVISKVELQMFLEFAPAYFEYMAKTFFHNLPSVLCKILGVYVVRYHNKETGKKVMENVVVMENIFYKRNITKVFDLKGSSRARYAETDGVKMNSFDDSIVQRRRLRRMKHVSEMAAKHGMMMDGSSSNASESPVRDSSASSSSFRGRLQSTGTDAAVAVSAASSSSLAPNSPAPGAAAAAMSKVLLDDNLMELTRGRPVPLKHKAKLYFHKAVLNDTLFLSIVNVVDYSILVGFDEDTHEIVVGIIDYLRQYDIIKKMERVGKGGLGMVTGQAEPTIIQPSQYRKRFSLAMEKYFMTVPDKWISHES